MLDKAFLSPAIHSKIQVVLSRCGAGNDFLGQSVVGILVYDITQGITQATNDVG